MLVQELSCVAQFSGKLGSCCCLAQGVVGLEWEASPSGKAEDCRDECREILGMSSKCAVSDAIRMRAHASEFGGEAHQRLVIA